MAETIRKTISQTAVDRLYSELYEKISSAQIEAKSQKKNIVILLAERHTNLNSVFLETMIFDICSRLGIKKLGRETDEATLFRITERYNNQYKTPMKLFRHLAENSII